MEDLTFFDNDRGYKCREHGGRRKDNEELEFESNINQ